MEWLSLYEPVNCLKPVTKNVWIADGDITAMAMYGVKVPFTTRMTVIRLRDGSLWLHSPIAWNASLAKQLEALGTISHLVSPNKIHYAHIAGWAERYPEARTWASPGVRERAAGQGIAVSFSDDLESTAPSCWAAELEQLHFRGSAFMEEVVFFHRPSRTLILADLIENFHPSKVHWAFRPLLRLAGVLAPHGQAPKDFRFTFWLGRAQARRSLAKMLEWQPERILLSHGDWIMRDGSNALKKAFRWLD